MNEPRPIQILLADDHQIVLDGLAALIQPESDMEVVGMACNGHEVIHLLKELRVDVCVLDVNMPDMDGIQTAAWMHEHRPDIKSLVLSTHEDEWLIRRMLAVGVQGYVLKNIPREQLLRAIRQVASGATAFSEPVQNAVLQMQRQRKEHVGLPPVTRRELEILNLLSQGLTNEATAEVLHISWRTVETHRKNLMHKTGCTNLASLLRYAYENGLLMHGLSGPFPHAPK